jgi:hypothetical protein
MRKRLTTVLLTVSTVTSMIGLTTTSSAATTATWTVKPGGSVTANGSVTVRDPKTGTLFRCHSVTLTGALRSGHGLPGAGIGSVSGATFTKCVLVTGALTLTAHSLPWHVNAVSYDTADHATSGSFTGIDLSYFGGIVHCTMTLDGTAAGAGDGVVDFRYANSTGKLAFQSTGGDLHFYGVSGCLGLFSNGDRAVVTGTLTVSPKQEITSP